MARTYYLNHLEHNPDQQDIYRRHYLSPNSIISFDVRGGKAEAFCFLNALKLIKLAVSLGGTESLAEHPDTMTHSNIMLDVQREISITPQMLRLSIDVKNPQDLILNLSQAFGTVGVAKQIGLEIT